ncbi:MAG: cobalt ECF transporter T component CbiQ [Verrucomicrobia bacterium]|nr:cobalt ECF transporter T component CbiQ [Verrucomicrobiota bacterium]
MRLELFESHSRLDSPIHRLPTAVKLAVAIAVVLTTVLLPVSQPGCFAFVGAAVLIAAVLSRIPPAFLAKRLLLLEPIAFGVAALAFFQPGGWRVFAVVMVRTNLCLLTMILLSNTTPFADILRVLQRLRVPSLMVTTMALMYRYLLVLADEVGRMSRARASRTFAAQHRAAWWSQAGIIGQLFIRSTERAERIYAAMCARGWQ